jgi:glycosyltransferase involved in cell wall biosynthesis
MSKLVFVNRFFFPDQSATSRMVSDLAFHLAGRGYRVAVVTSRLRYEDAAAAYPALESVAGVEVHRVWTSSFGRFVLPGRAFDYLTFYLSAARALNRLLRAGDVVVAKTDPPLISVVAQGAASRRGAHLVNWTQDLFPEIAAALGVGFLNGRFGRWVRRLRNRSLARADMTVAIGERMAQRLVAEGVPEDRVRIIHNWVDGDVIHPLPRQGNPVRAEWGLEDRFAVGYSGNFGRVHEYETVLAAAALLSEEKDVVFVFIGGGASLDRFKEACALRHLENVRFFPYQPEERLRESLGACDLHLVILRPEIEGLVVPSKFYGVAAAGRPTLFIGDPEGEIARLIGQAEAGLWVKTGDGEALAAAVRRLRDDAVFRENLGRNARALFDRAFSRDRALAAWEEALGTVLSRRSRAAR